MSVSQLLQKEVQQYLLDHEQSDEAALVLKHKTLFGIPASRIAEQLRARRKAKDKLPLFYRTKNIIYPPQLNLEQSSSEATAKFKADLLSGKSLVDLTGGFGIDSYFFCQRFDHVFYVEPDSDLQEIVNHNCRILGAGNISFHNISAEEYLKMISHIDVAYIDPSRRTGSTKIVKLADCSPDITVLQKDILKRSYQLLVKASPLLDIQMGLSELINVSDVYVVSVNNECKELLFLSGQTPAEPVIHTVNLLSDGSQQSFDFTFSQERASLSNFSNPKTYIYEPNASILKGGAFRSIAVPFDVEKISPNTHLYTSDNLVDNFPGRIFRVKNFVKPEAAEISKMIPERKANVITRNYPLATELLKKKLKINDGGEDYILAFAGQKEKFVAVAKRIK